MPTSDTATLAILESYRDKVSGRIPRSLTAPLLEKLAGCNRKQAGDLLHQAHDADDARLLALVQQQAIQITLLNKQVAELLARLDAKQEPSEMADEAWTKDRVGLAIAGIQATAEKAVARAEDRIERVTEHWATRIQAVDARLHRLEHWSIREVGALRKQITSSDILLGWVCGELINHVTFPAGTAKHLQLVARLRNKPLGKVKFLSQTQRASVCKQAADAPWEPIFVEDEPIYGDAERFVPQIKDVG